MTLLSQTDRPASLQFPCEWPSRATRLVILLGLLLVVPCTVGRAQEPAPPPAIPAAPDPDAPPPQEDATGEAAPKQDTPPAVIRPFLRRLLFGEMDDESDEEEADEPGNADSRSAKRSTDPRAPIDQKLTGLLKRAQTQAKNGNYRDALEMIRRLLEQPDDSLHEAAEGKLISVRTTAQRLLATFPPEEQERYRAQFGGAARRELEAALRSGAVHELAQVATRYFQTPAGFDAANQLAARYFDRGEFGLAAVWYVQLLEAQAPVTRDPAWRLRAEWVAQRIDSTPLKKVLAAHQLQGTAPPLVGGQPTDPATFLKSHQTAAETAAPTNLQEWLQFFGTARRRGQVAGSEPLLLKRWAFPLTQSESIRQRIRQLNSDLRDGGETPIFAFEPLLVGGKVVFRSLRGVKVVDANSGRLLWETADEMSAEDVMSSGGSKDAADMAGDGRQALAGLIRQELQNQLELHPAPYNPLTNLLFRNSNHGLLSSDGQRLFVVEDQAILTDLEFADYWGGDAPDRDSLGRTVGVNRLRAYDLKSGHSLWEAGGPSLSDPFELPLAGNYFFGVPVIDRNELFVVGEKDGTVRLHVLDAATGKHRWSQVLGHAQARIGIDTRRRWMSAPVSVGDGIIVCPTTIGWMVAVDRSTHHILWAYRYSNEANGADEPYVSLIPETELKDRWAAAPPIIDGDRVVFSPPEHSKLLCVGLSDGRRIWDVDRFSSIFVAGIFHDHVITVAPKLIRCINIQNGESKQIPFTQKDARPTGRGLALGDKYFLPMDNGELQVLNLKDLTFEAPIFLPESRDPLIRQLGNLSMYRGMLLSLSPHGMVAFGPRQSGEMDLTQQQPLDPQLIAATLRQAELDLLDRNYQGVRDVLSKLPSAGLSAEQETRRRETLRTALQALVRAAPGGGDTEFAELRQLAQTSEDQQRVEQLQAERLLHRQDYTGAFAAYVRFARTFRGQTVVLQEVPMWRTTAEGWAQSRLSELFRTAPANVSTQLDQLVRETLADVVQQPAEWSGLLPLFRDHPAGVSFTRDRVEQVITAGEYQVAENLLRDLESNPTQHVWARDRLARLWHDIGYHSDAAYYYRLMEQEDKSLPWDQSRTVGQMLAEKRAGQTLPEFQTTPVADWQNHKLSLQRLGGQFDPNAMVTVCQQSGAGLPFFRDHRVQVPRGEPRLEIVDMRTEDRIWSQPIRDSQATQGLTPTMHIRGHQIHLLQGTSITALSPLNRRVLWSYTFDDAQSAQSVDQNVIYEDHRGPRSVQWLTQQSRRSRGFGFGMTDIQFDYLTDDGAMLATHASPVLLNERYLALAVRRTLVVIDTNSGKEIWCREGQPNGFQIFGGADALYVWNPVNERVTAYAPADGTQLKPNHLSSLCRSAVSHVGSDLIVVRRSNLSLLSAKERLERFDPVHERVIWSLELPPKVRATLISGDRLALLHQDGRLQICNLKNGQVTPCGSLSKNDLRKENEIYLIPTYDQLLVVVHSERSFDEDYNSEGFRSLRVMGTVSSLDWQTGEEKWKQAVSPQHLILENLDYSPVVLFLSRRLRADDGSPRVAILAIDRQRGQVVHESEQALHAGLTQFGINLSERYIELRSHIERYRLEAKP